MRCVHSVLALLAFVFGLQLVGEARQRLEQGPPPVFASTHEPRAEPPTHAAARDLGELQARVRAIAGDRLRAGVSFAVVEGGRTVWTEGLGLADIEAERRASADTVYRVGSLSKSVFALTMASLEHDGLLDLDAPVRDIVRDVEFENAWEDVHPIRVTELLQHSAGFDEMRFNEMFATREQLEWSTERVLSLNPRSRRARWQPGTRHSYSHPGYTLAGHVVEVVTGRPYEASVRERVFDPLGMRNASYVPTPAVEAELAVAYTGKKLQRMEHLLLHHRPGSHVYASAREMGRVIELLSNRGVVDGRRVMPRAIIDRLEQGGTLPYPGLVPSYGLGLYVVQTRGVLWYTHGGWMPGHHSALRYLPGAGAGFVIMTNEEWDQDVVWEIEDELIAYLQRDARPAVPLPRVELEPAELEAFAGTYAARGNEVEFATAFELRAPAVVDVVGSDLRLRRKDRSWQLVPVGGGRFRRDDQPFASVIFTNADDGTPVLHDGWGFVHHERISSALAIACRVLLAFTFVALGLGVLWPTIWIGPALGGKCKAAVRAWPCAGAWSVYLYVDTLYETPVTELGTFNWSTASLFALSWSIPICAVVGVVVTVLALVRRRDTIPVRIAAAVTTLGVCVATIHFAWHGVLGVRTWLW